MYGQFLLITESEPLDSWDAEEDSILTPEDEEMELDDGEVDGENVAKVAKKKIVKVEESKSKKEHVNVVFIGHVGKYDPVMEVVPLYTQGIFSFRCRQIHHRWPNYVPNRYGR